MRFPTVCLTVLGLALVATGVLPSQGLASGLEGTTAAPSTTSAPLAAAPAPTADDPVANGKATFRRTCRACHSVEAGGGGGAGPNLSGVVGRVIGSTPGYEYSEAFKAAAAKGSKWDAKSLDAFLAKPAEVMPDTTMPLSTPQAKARQDLIAYMATLTE